MKLTNLVSFILASVLATVLATPMALPLDLLSGNWELRVNSL